MRYLADTNVFAENPSLVLRRWINAHTHEIRIAWTTVAELRSGVATLEPGARRDRLDRLVEEVVAGYYVADDLPYSDSTAKVFAEIQARRKAAAETKSWQDTTIAAVAMEHGLIVATCNARDFNDVPTVNPSKEKAPGDRSQGE